MREAKRRVEKMLVNGEGLWGLVNNAGVASIPGATDWMDKRDIVGCLNVNIIGESISLILLSALALILISALINFQNKRI